MNKYANLVGTNKIKDEYTKINTGFDGVETDIDALNDRVDALDSRVDTIITTPIDGEAAAQEIVDARVSAVKSKTFASLDARFEETEQDIATHKADYAKDKADYIYMYRTQLNNVNLNILVDFGCYRLIGGNSNIPPGFNGYGLMIVNYAYSGYMTQEIIEVASGKKWVRSTTAARATVKAGDATWQPWRHIYTSIEIPEGTGSPEGVVVASVGTLYRRIDVGELYVKITGTGNTGWGKVTVA